MQYAKWVAIAICIAMVVGALAAWDVASSAFDTGPNATELSTTSCPATSCGRFDVLSANLTVTNGTNPDVVDYVGIGQTLQFGVLPGGITPMTSIHVYLDNVSLGTDSGHFALGVVSQLDFDVPTSISVEPGQTYTVQVEGVYPNASAGAPGQVWVSLQLVAQE